MSPFLIGKGLRCKPVKSICFELVSQVFVKDILKNCIRVDVLLLPHDFFCFLVGPVSDK